MEAKGKLPNLKIIVKNDIPMVQTRFKVKLSLYFGTTELPMVLGSSTLSYLMCLDAHQRCHKAEKGSLAVSRQTCFVIGAQKVLVQIKKRCMECKKRDLVKESQTMGDLPSELQRPEPTFTRICWDQ